ncbi:MAG TPA: hypothetical protein VE173_07585 [Longimicrobiales bacterium]|nr:hypothetical protein [Longimicrobiales bacterium]
MGPGPQGTVRLQALLFRVDAGDWRVVGVVGALMLAVAVAAALVPGHHATRVDPSEALRAE